MSDEFTAPAARTKTPIIRRGDPINATFRTTPTPAAPTDEVFLEDLRLMQRVAAGDRSAQSSLAARLSGRVRRVSGALLRNSSDAEDAAQIALLEILRSAGNYRGVGAVERWADRLVARVSGRIVRERRQLQGRLDPDADFEQISITPPESSAADDVPRPMSDYLDVLPEQLRMVLVLRHGFGYSMEEIGDLVEATPNAAKKRLNRASQALRRMIRRDRVVGIHLGRGTE